MDNEMLEDYPHLRDVQSPITGEQLRPFDRRCKTVQFSNPLSDSDHKKLAKFLRGHPEVKLRVYGHYSKPCTLDFLKHYPFARQVDIQVYSLTDISGFHYVSNDLESLVFGQTKSSRYSLGFLRNFPNLKRLVIESHTKDIEAIGELTNLLELRLSSITLPDLVLLKPLRRLRSFALSLGGTKELGLLPEIGELRYLELLMIKGLSDLSSVGSIATLEYLSLEALKNVRNLPSFHRLRSLRRVDLLTMKGLSDLRPVADAPNLEEFLAVSMQHLEIESFRPFVGHSTLKKACVGLGSEKKNRALAKVLNLPDVDSTPFRFSDDNVGNDKRLVERHRP
jgi:hypothetical protein